MNPIREIHACMDMQVITSDATLVNGEFHTPFLVDKHLDALWDYLG